VSQQVEAIEDEGWSLARGSAVVYLVGLYPWLFAPAVSNETFYNVLIFEKECAMWLGHDLAWWAFVLSVLTLILTVPLGVVAIVLAPVIQQWWAERSIAGREARLGSLKKRLAYLQTKYAVISDFEDRVLRALEGFALFAAIGFQLMGGVIVMTLFATAQPVLTRAPDSDFALKIFGALGAVALICTIVQMTFLAAVHGPLWKFRLNRSPAIREGLTESIKRLTEKLNPGKGEGER
jgi:hypothetical protein